MAIAGSLVANTSAKTDDFRAGMQRMRRDMAEVRTGADQLGSAFTQLGQRTLGLAAGVVSVGALTAGVRDLVRVGVELQSLRTSFQAITGSAKAGREEFDFVSQTALRFGQNIQELGRGYRSLTAATRGTALGTQEVRDLFTQVTAVSAAYGLSTEQTGRALVAFQQIISKGKVSQEELRGQLAEAIPGANQIAARGYGVTTQALDKLIESGLDSIEFVKRFTEQLAREAPVAAQSAQTAFGRLGAELSLFKDRVASDILPLLERVAGFASRILQANREASERATSARAAGIRSAGVDPNNPRQDLVAALGSINSQLKTAESEVTRLEAAAARNPAIQAGGMLAEAQERLRMLRIEQQALVSTLQQEGLERQRTLTISTQASDSETEAIRKRRQAYGEIIAWSTGQYNELLNNLDRTHEKEKELEEETRAGAESRKSLFRQVQGQQDQYLEGLQDELDLLSMTRNELERQKLAQAALDEPQRRRATAILDEIQQRRLLRDEMEALFERSRETMRKDEETREQQQQDSIEEARRRNRELRDLQKERNKDLREETGRFADFFTETILSATDIAKRGFSGFVDSVLGNLQRLLVRQYLAPALNKILDAGIQLGLAALRGAGTSAGGAGVGDATTTGTMGSIDFDLYGRGPLRDSGGPVYPGHAYLVGATEFFVPGEAGTMVPMGEMGRSTPTIIMNFNGPTDKPGILRSRGEIEAAMVRTYQGAQRAAG